MAENFFFGGGGGGEEGLDSMPWLQHEAFSVLGCARPGFHFLSCKNGFTF